MRRLATVAFALGALGVLGGDPLVGQDRPRFRVLLVGFTKMDKAIPFAMGAGDLPGDLDVSMMRDVLVDKFEVPSESITVLDKPEQLHKQNVLRAMREKLLDGVRPDDVVVFYFSGHGLKCLDTSKATGRSQALVMSDSRSMLNERGAPVIAPGAAGQTVVDSATLLSGPEIGEFLDDLSKAGARKVTVVFDACYSGGATRGDFIEKGAVETTTDLKSGAQRDGTLAEIAARPGVVALLSSQSNELSRAISGRGSVFTLGMVKALVSGKFDSYSDLLRSTEFYMNRHETPIQRPTSTGDGAVGVFGGTYVPTPFSLTVFPSGDGLYLKSGSLAGISQGFVVGLFSRDADPFQDEPKATLEVVSTGPTRSLLRWVRNKVTDEKELLSLRALVIDGFGDTRIRVWIDPKANVLRSEVLKSKFVEVLVDKADAEFCVVQDSERSLYVTRADKRIAELRQDEATRDWMAIPPSVSVDRTKAARRLQMYLVELTMGKAFMSIQQTEPAPFAIETSLFRSTESGIDWTTSLDGQPVRANDKYCLAVRVMKTGHGDAPKDVFVSFVTVEGDGLWEVLWPTSDDRGGRVETSLSLVPVDGEWYFVTNKSGFKRKGDPATPLEIWSYDSNVSGSLDHIKAFATVSDERFDQLGQGGTRNGRYSRLGSALAAFETGTMRDASRMGRITDPWAVAQTYVRPLESKGG